MARISSLDSLRGLAALAVVLHHCTEFSSWMHEDYSSLYQGWFDAPMAWLYLTPLRILVAGPSAVLIFFVLSGLVLSLSMGRDTYFSFMVKRVCRIWLPFAFAIVVAALLSEVLPQVIPANTVEWFKFLLEPATLHTLVVHLAMTGVDTILDPPMWSLIHELRISAIFPLLVASILWNWRVTLIGLVTASLIATVQIQVGHLSSYWKTLLQTVQYLFLFGIGIAIASHLDDIRAWLLRIPSMMRYGLWAAALIGVCFGPKTDNNIVVVADMVHVILSGFASAILVVLCAIDGHAIRFLKSGIPRFLGKISYSLYLMHWIVMAATVRLIGNALPLPVSLVIGVILSLSLAVFVERFVERPTMHLGRTLANHMDGVKRRQR